MHVRLFPRPKKFWIFLKFYFGLLVGRSSIVHFAMWLCMWYAFAPQARNRCVASLNLIEFKYRQSQEVSTHSILEISQFRRILNCMESGRFFLSFHAQWRRLARFRVENQFCMNSMEHKYLCSLSCETVNIFFFKIQLHSSLHFE